jgi:hypothetical protein
MPKHADTSLILIFGAAAFWFAPALADDPAWILSAAAPSAGSMSRTVDNVTLTYTRNPADSDGLRLTVRDCGDTPWDIEESLNGVTAERLRDAVKEEFENARLNCKLADGIEDRFMIGFDEAFAKVKPFLPPHTAAVGGWQLADVGGMPGDDSERKVTLSRTLGGLKMTYEPSGEDRAGLTFACEGSSYGTGFDFGNPPEDHVKVITAEVTEAFGDLAKDCKPKPPAQAALMQDFPEALKTLEQWLAAKPFVYPPDKSSN